MAHFIFLRMYLLHNNHTHFGELVHPILHLHQATALPTTMPLSISRPPSQHQKACLPLPYHLYFNVALKIFIVWVSHMRETMILCV